MPSYIFFKHISDYPSDRETGWTSNLQGVTHDDDNWFITQKYALWKIPVGVDINSAIDGTDPNRRIVRVPFPTALEKHYDHLGDLDYYAGHLLVPVEKGGSNRTARIACFDPVSLAYLDSVELPEQKEKAPWCAVNPADGLLYSSRDADVNTLFAYRFHIGSNNLTITLDHKVSLKNEQGGDLKIGIQGGVFSDENGENHLYLSSDDDDDRRGVHVFHWPEGRRVGKISIPKDSGTIREEIEGLTYWDLDSGQALGISGKLHVQELDWDANKDDIKCFKHYAVAYAFQIINRPPFVEHVIIKSGQAGLKPIGFGKLNDTSFPVCAKCKTVYDASWRQNQHEPERHLSGTGPGQTIPSDRIAYIFVRFGGTGDPSRNKSVTDLKLSFSGHWPANAPTSVELKEGIDPKIGYYYWGAFTPVNHSDNRYPLTLEIEARDVSAHLASRPSNYEGYLLDSQPKTVAYVNVFDPPQYAIENYEPGKDTHHIINIAPREEQTSVSWTEPNNSRKTSASITLDLANENQFTLNGVIIAEQGDQDCFLIQFESSSEDDDYYAPSWEGHCSSGGILQLCTIPACLYVVVDEEFGNCLDVNTYDSIGIPLADQFQFSTTSHITCTIWFPNRVSGETNKIYLKVKSHDFSTTGVVRYRIHVGYKGVTTQIIDNGVMTALDSWIESNAILRAWKWGPDPPLQGIPDELQGVQLFMKDFQDVVSMLENHADEIVDELHSSNQQERATLEGDLFLGLGYIAITHRHPEIAEREFEQSSALYEHSNNKTMQRRSLVALEGVYRSQGKIAKANVIAKRLSGL